MGWFHWGRSVWEMGRWGENNSRVICVRLFDHQMLVCKYACESKEDGVGGCFGVGVG